MKKTLVRTLSTLLICAMLLTACTMPGGGDSVTINLDDIGGPYFFDGSCFPDSFTFTAHLSGDTSSVSIVVYDLIIHGAGGTHIEYTRDLPVDPGTSGTYSGLIDVASFVSGIEEEELSGEFTIRALDSRGAALGQASRTFRLELCSFEEVMTIRPEVSTRDLLYGAGCASSVNYIVTISRFTPLPSGVHMTAYWLAREAGGGVADVAAHAMTMRDLTTPGSIHFYEYSDTLTITDEFIHDVEALLGPLNLSSDPIFVLEAIYGLSGSGEVEQLWQQPGITIAVHPCSARPMPTATPLPTATPTLIVFPTATKKPGDQGVGGGGQSCSLSEDKCAVGGEAFDKDNCKCVPK